MYGNQETSRLSKKDDTVENSDTHLNDGYSRKEKEYVQDIEMSPRSSWNDLSNCANEDQLQIPNESSTWLFELTCRLPNEEGSMLLKTVRLSSSQSQISDSCSNDDARSSNDRDKNQNYENKSSPLLDPLLSSNQESDGMVPKSSGWSFARIGSDDRNESDPIKDNRWGISSENAHMLSLTYHTRTENSKTSVFREVYSLDEDILHVQKLENSKISIPGLSCSFSIVRLFLRSKQGSQYPSNVPSFMSTNDNQLSIDSQNVLKPPWCGSLNDQKDIFGPVVIFALPSESLTSHYSPPPALLWKVQIPPSDNDTLLLESITMFDGKLNYTPMVTDPTHIYINGYQSWSFAGTVKRAYAQPTSAMPNIFSKAFNEGGTIPSTPSSERVKCSVCSFPCISCTCLCPKNREENPKKGSRISSIYNLSSFRKRNPMSSFKSNIRNHYKDLAFYKSDLFTCITSSLDHYESLDENGAPALILGWLSQHHQFGIITADQCLERLIMHCSLGDDGVHLASRKKKSQESNFVQTDWGYCQLIVGNNNDEYDEEPLAHYLSAAAAYNRARPFLVDQYQEPSVGWCSWYHYYEKIDAETLINNFQRLNNLRLHISPNVAIIDDGYMTAWGDWDSLKPKQFSNFNNNSTSVLKVLADEIRNAGMKPGLWLAPFACDKHSMIAKQHPDWIIRNHSGRASNSANCGKFFYGLDATNPAVRAHAYRAVRRAVQEWGYETLKLDFLYAACLSGTNKFDPTLSRAETMHLALQTVREAAGPATFLIGCGCPLGTAIGIVDGMRISADTGPTYYPEFPLPKWDNGTLPSLRAMIRNSLTRSGMGHRWWHNDPDCVLLGETTKLNDFEVISAATIVAMTGGMMLLSDDLTKLSNERLKIGTRIYPVTGATAVPMDLHCHGAENMTGLPNLLKFWCVDSMKANSSNETGSVSEQPDSSENMSKKACHVGNNKDALDNARWNSYSEDNVLSNPNERVRTCLRVASGLGVWSVVSLSNWRDESAVINVPMKTLTKFPQKLNNSNIENCAENGYHVFAFWSSTYLWLPNSKTQPNLLSKRLNAHESEIFHIKAVRPIEPQYVGSDIHFSCGYEIEKISFTPNTFQIKLKNFYKRSGFVYIYVPYHDSENKLSMEINGKERKSDVICTVPFINNDGSSLRNAGRVVRIWVEIPGTGHRDENGAMLMVRY